MSLRLLPTNHESPGFRRGERQRNDSLLQNAAAEKTPKEILGMVSNPIKLGKELGKLEAQRKREKKNPVKAPVQANQKVNNVSGPVKQ